MSRIAVVCGTERFNPTNMAMFREAARYSRDLIDLVCSEKTYLDEPMIGLPIRRTPASLLGPLTKTMWGGFLVGKVSRLRYLHNYLPELTKAVKDYEILVPPDPGHPTTFQCIQERKRGKLVVPYCAENIPYNWPHDRPLKESFETALDEADHFLIHTDGGKRAYKAMGVREDRISRINVGVDTEYWKPGDMPRYKRDSLRILFVGRLIWGKGLHTVLEAMEASNATVYLTVVGSGPELNRVRWMLREREKRGNDRLKHRVSIISDYLPAGLLLSMRQYHDAQVCPSIPIPQWREQMNISMLEGMSTGLPTIASMTGGHLEAVTHNREGLLFAPDDPDGLAECFNSLTGNADTLDRMSANARSRITGDFEATKQGLKLAEMFAKLQGKTVDGSILTPWNQELTEKAIAEEGS